MKQRSPIAVFLLPLVTFGIYSMYWLVKTKGELNQVNDNKPRIPTAWIWLIPVVGNIWWLWEYAGGVQKQSKGACSQALAFILLFLLGSVGQAIVQHSYYNKK